MAARSSVEVEPSLPSDSAASAPTRSAKSTMEFEEELAPPIETDGFFVLCVTFSDKEQLARFRRGGGGGGGTLAELELERSEVSSSLQAGAGR